jgi:hypothetical protein
MTRDQALYLIKTVDSRHQEIQPMLRKAARGEKITNEEFEKAGSPFAPVVGVLRDIQSGNADADTRRIIENLDTRNDVLKPLLLALMEGFELPADA